ncbi:LysR family transcriptional regulator [Tardiphaga sp. vice352]|uniref:LysR family transcriptional regulator n=1 Tax=unclassified Tardiphaga TaxID=2631404 RepID=UPI001164D5A2|nr:MULTISPECIES: LysR family transcriptional regulator [unclassified Tardiphaga]QDM14723.1 LysR family transcriptional regulator [Tardiphaga sp. vice278]QDM19882.1 LysR family transcriptional regulator [Tardiphaga sp. vice154]QDM24902.1 LysR family transcriptional regulator [Tardiphaga sp. vice304]QDM30112.1 LysR family transcriptional regulator [Tardiphaga sp. vice352]
MELAWLDDFIELSERLNFSRAAEARHVTQPAFSRRIQALESWIGTPLFARSTHGVTLTAAGLHLRSRADAMARDIRQLRSEALDVAGRETAALSFTATHALSFTFFPKWIREQERAAPLGTLNLISDSMAACEQIMQRGRAQFLLCHAHRNSPNRLDADGFDSAVVGHDVLIPLAAPAPDGGALWSLDEATKAPIPYLAYSAESGLGRIVAAHKARKRRALDNVFTSQLAATLHSLALARRGIAWLPQSLAQDDIDHGRLVAAGGRASRIAVEIRLYRPHAHQGRAAEALWARLKV